MSAPHKKQTAKQMRLGPATQAALFSWTLWLAVYHPKAIDNRDTRTRERASPRDTHLGLAPTGLLIQRFHPALEGGFL